ncbi:hypothetical protein F66182_5307 [Fusarium sp. NRRL 66182]|nr:hypothetical protein F66182_5307 [Fusarium sp. NRRL 66182]
MAVIAETLSKLQAQHVFVALIVILVFVTGKPYIGRLRPPRGAPHFLRHNLALDAPRFSKRRIEYLQQGIERSANGFFSFWYGANHIVAVSGSEARSTFLTARGFDPLSGYARAGFQVYKKCRQDDHISQNLHHLITDSHDCFKALGSAAVINPLEMMIGLVYQLTHRIVGIHDIAESPDLLAKTRKIYKPLEEHSLFDIWFPLLPTPSKLNKFWGYTKLHWMVQGFINERRSTGKRGTDGLQLMLDQGCGDWIMSIAITAAIIAGVFNTSISAVWNLCYLARDPTWLSRVRSEIDYVLSKHQQGPDESSAETLYHLTLKDWESSFPSLELALKETLRFTMSGAMLRKNIVLQFVTPGTELSIRFADSSHLQVYSVKDIHMNPQVYESPSEWNPRRHSEESAKSKETPYPFLGWGAGSHPCPGMRFAHLNMLIPTVMFLATYDFQMCDANGGMTKEPMPDLTFDTVGAGRPERQVYMKLTERVSSST